MARKTVIDGVIRHNAFFAHPENVLLSMLSDTRKENRQFAVDMILKARQKTVSGANTRQFRVPEINIDANDLKHLINWPSEAVEPPILRDVSENDIKLCAEDENKIVSMLSKYPCHTQAVERTVKLVTEASRKVCGFEARDGYIRSSLTSRQIMAKFNTKNEFAGLSSSSDEE